MKRFACLVLVGACGGFIDKQAATSTLKILKSSSTAAMRQSDVELAHDALPGGIIQLEAFAIAYPDRREFRVLHATALCQYATAFIMDDWDDAKLGHREAEVAHLEGRLSGLLASCVDAQLALQPPAWRAAHAAGNDAMIAYLPTITKAQASALLAIATAEASMIALSPFTHLAELPRVKAELERGIALVPGADDARGELVLGSIAAGQSMFLGGDDGASYFATARTLAGPRHLLTEVLYARGVAVAHRDRETFERVLGEVIAADAGQWPEHRLANELAKRKARRYLAAEDELLPVPAAAPAPDADPGSAGTSSN